MKVLIIDDSRLARLELSEQLKAFPEFDLVGEADTVQQAKLLITEHKPDVLLLDINMPGGDGFSLLDQLDCQPYVIFVTAYDQYALKSFEYSALDYLLKPVTTSRLKAALDKLPPLQNISSVLSGESPLFIKDLERCFFMKLKDVIAFEAMGNYTRVHLAEGAPSIYRSLSAVTQRLPEPLFFKANRSWVINTAWVRSIDCSISGGFEVGLAKNLQVEISRRQATIFRQQLSL